MGGGLSGGCSAFSFEVRNSLGVVTRGERLLRLSRTRRVGNRGSVYLVAKGESIAISAAATAVVPKDRTATGLITFRIGSNCSSCNGGGYNGTPVSGGTRFTCAASLGTVLRGNSRGGFDMNGQAFIF